MVPVDVVEPRPSAAPVSRAGSAGAAASASANPERRLGLAPEDLFFAPWRALPPLELAEPAPFDRSACLARLAKFKPPTYGRDWDWSPLGIRAALSREEASFWLSAMARAQLCVATKDLARALAAEPEESVEAGDAAAVRAAFALSPWFHSNQVMRTAGELDVPPEMLAAVRALLGAEAAAELVLELSQAGASDGVLEGFRRFVLPYLSLPARDALASRLRPLLATNRWPSDFYTVPAAEFRLAALLGAPDELQALVESWPDDRYDARGLGWEVDHYHAPQLVIFGLRSADLVQHHLRRLKLPLRDPVQLRGYLAHTEYSGLDWAGDSVAQKSNREDAAQLMEVLTAVEAPENATVMLELLGSKAPKQAREWLMAHPAHTAFGLTELAGSKGKRAAAALELLAELKRHGHVELLRAAAAAASPDAARKVTEQVIEREEKEYAPFGADDAPPWLREGVAAAKGLKKVKAPTWIAPVDLPPVVVGERRLNDEQVGALLRVLQAAPLVEAGKPLAPEHRLLSDLLEHADRRALGAFAWRLFERWLIEGAPSKEKWALLAVGHLGDDVCALELAPMVRVWPGESQHQRAVLGLDVLRAIGSDTALMQINGIATKLKFKALKARAQECMEAIAAVRGMTRPELEDRIVPDLDLDATGRRAFDYGPRRFEFVLGPDLKPLVRDEDGKLKKDPPKPGAKDDAALAEAALAEWKLFKKQLRELMKIQPERLEQAMVIGRRWGPDEFRQLLVEHPLMTHLVRLLLWGDYPRSGAPRPFRVSDERELLDADDEPVALEGMVGLVHPLELDEAQRGRWGEVFADYELLAPFSQLGREVQRIAPAEAASKRLVRLEGRKVPGATLVSTLERLGWTRGVPQDAGIFSEHTKQFPGAQLTAVLSYEDGLAVGYLSEADDQEVTGVTFLQGLQSPDDCVWVESDRGLALGEVDPIVLSEVLRDLSLLEGKAR